MGVRLSRGNHRKPPTLGGFLGTTVTMEWFWWLQWIDIKKNTLDWHNMRNPLTHPTPSIKPLTSFKKEAKQRPRHAMRKIDKMYLGLFWGIPRFWHLKFLWAMAHWLPAFEFKPSCPHSAPSQFWASRHEGCSKCNHCAVPPSELPPGWSSYVWSHLHQYWSHPYHSPTPQSWSPSYQHPRNSRSSSARWSFQLPGSQTEL